VVNRGCEAFELVKEAEMKRFGEISYFYRKMSGLSPADSDDDPDLGSDDVHAHGFEEPEEEGCRYLGRRGHGGRYR
jgi:hypothetical protein